jgi:hypothetical protein
VAVQVFAAAVEGDEVRGVEMQFARVDAHGVAGHESISLVRLILRMYQQCSRQIPANADRSRRL